MRLSITHRTAYHYGAPIPYALQQLRMIPKDSAGQKVIEWTTQVEGGTRQVEYFDQHNNHVELFSLDPDQVDVVIRCEGVVETSDTAGAVGKHGGFAPLWYFLRSTARTKPGPSVRKMLREFEDPGAGDGDAVRLHALSNHIRDLVAYKIGETGSDTTAEQSLSEGHGVCQDHAHIFLSAARLLGYPARYVSGYLLIDGVIDQDAGHAWAEAHIPHLGWIGFDVSNGISPDPRYVRVATGLDHREAAPASGMVMGGVSESLDVDLRVQEQQQDQIQGQHQQQSQKQQ